MIIPANEDVALRLAEIPLRFRMILDDLDYHLRKTCDDDIILFEIDMKTAIFDLPKRSKENGAIKLVDIINQIWVYDPDIDDESVARIDRDKTIGWFLKIKMGTKTSNLSRDYLSKVVEIKGRMKQ